MKWYKRDPDAALAGMMELTLQERGGYNGILDLLYSRDGLLPDDDQMISRMLSCHGNEWRSIKRKLIAKGKIWIEGGILRANRVETALKEATNASETQRKRAGKRWERFEKSSAATGHISGNEGVKSLGNSPETPGKLAGNSRETPGKLAGNSCHNFKNINDINDPSMPYAAMPRRNATHYPISTIQKEKKEKKEEKKETLSKRQPTKLSKLNGKNGQEGKIGESRHRRKPDHGRRTKDGRIWLDRGTSEFEAYASDYAAAHPGQNVKMDWNGAGAWFNVNGEAL